MDDKIRLTPEQYQKQLDVERNLSNLLLEIDKMEECDIDCQAFRQQVRQRIDQSVKLRENFGPQSKLG